MSNFCCTCAAERCRGLGRSAQPTAVSSIERGGAWVATVRRWSGAEARALRIALRFSVRGFAEHLGISARTVSKWEAAGAATFPRPDTQAMLDTVLTRAGSGEQQRFEMLCLAAADLQVGGPRPRRWEYESWTDDLERTSVALSRQDFALASTLVGRWLARFPLAELDEHGAYLHARSLFLKGGIRRDQGQLHGPGSARTWLLAARDEFARLRIESRVAQTDLGLVVLDEMSGELESAARGYEKLSHDARLGERDRALALLWVGTALSKVPRADATEQAIKAMASATQVFERLDEAADWSVAQQKLALAHRARGDLDSALSYIDLAERSVINDSPLQIVRLNTARAHILLSEAATRGEGLRVIDSARKMAELHGLQHQLESMRRIRSDMVAG